MYFFHEKKNHLPFCVEQAPLYLGLSQAWEAPERDWGSETGSCTEPESACHSRSRSKKAVVRQTFGWKGKTKLWTNANE